MGVKVEHDLAVIAAPCDPLTAFLQDEGMIATPLSREEVYIVFVCPA
jgi:hypothetical protein